MGIQLPSRRILVTLTPFLSLNRPGDESLAWLKERLATANLRAMQTFDLHTARHALEDCPCPHHGTDACDCQMVVLLVYGEEDNPSTLILHGNDGQTWLSIAETPNQKPNAKTVSAIRNALEEKPPA